MAPENITPPDLAHCEREPIHIPGSIQPQGFLLASPGIDQPITHVSENARTLVGEGAAALGRSWGEIFGPAVVEALERVVRDPHISARPASVVASWSATHDSPQVELIAHVHNGFVIVEGEELFTEGDLTAAGVRHELAPFLARMGTMKSQAELYQLVTTETRLITGFDRVLIYQFDEDWNGTVIGESNNGVLPVYLGHRFPAGDIPKQARELYHINRLRLISSNDYQAVRIRASSADLPPLDLTLSTLRAISPIHLEYMRNMGTGSSMSVSIMREGRLWGLLSCHGREPRRLSFGTRSMFDLFGQILSLQLATRENSDQLSRQVELRHILSQSLTRMTQSDDFVAALDEMELLSLTGAHGAAILREDKIGRFGIAPADATLLALRDWVAPQCVDGIFSTDRLPLLYPKIGDESSIAGGFLAISISPDDKTFAFWFRAELVETVKWAGDPHKSNLPPSADMRVHPRKSFETWKETVSGRCSPWQPAELDAAMGFRRAVIDIVLKQASAKARLLTEVQRMNKELEAFAYTVSHDLRAPFRHVRGYAEVLQMEKNDLLDEDGRYLLGKILKSTAYAGDLVETLLAFSRMNLTPLETEEVDLNDVVNRARAHAMTSIDPKAVEWRVAPLPTVYADSNLLLLAIQNLLENALKYSARRAISIIEVGTHETEDEWFISIKDNGAGFDMRYADKLFGVFQRLHTSDQFTGLGIGLASVRRIIERHGGRVWAEGKVDQGATFHFTLPKIPPHSPVSK